MTNRNLLILDDMIEKLELFERKMNILEIKQRMKTNVA